MSTERLGVRYRIDERHGPGRLGRHVNHDERNARYLAPEADIAPPSITHRRYIGVLDQGQLGSCEGNGVLGVLGSGPLYGSLINLRRAYPPMQLVLDEAQAVKVYSDATAIDPFEGTYPPSDTGTDNTSAANAVLARGLIARFEHAYTTQAAFTAITKASLLGGFNWYSGMDSPDADGTVHVTGSIRGGHAFHVAGHSATHKRWKCYQSWGPYFGVNGVFYVTDADMTRLLAEDGELTLLLPQKST